MFFAYSGWNAAVYVAEEIREPERTLPIALILGTIAVAALYVLLNVLYIYALPLEQLKGVVAVGARAAGALFGDRVGGAFSAAMALGLLATVNAMCMIGPRVYYAMARNGAFFASAARLHPRWHSPWIAVLAQGICTLRADPVGHAAEPDQLHRLHAVSVHRVVGARALQVPPASRLETLTLGEHRLPADPARLRVDERLGDVLLVESCGAVESA